MDASQIPSCAELVLQMRVPYDRLYALLQSLEIA